MYIKRWEYDFAKLIVEGKQSLTDCYVQAHMDGCTPERTITNYTRADMSSRASKALQTDRVKKAIEALNKNIEVETAQKIIWDKIQATETLRKIIERNETTLEKLNEMTDPQDFQRVARLSTQISQSTMGAVSELNKLYGLYDLKTNVGVKETFYFTTDFDYAPKDDDDVLLEMENHASEFYESQRD